MTRLLLVHPFYVDTQTLRNRIKDKIPSKPAAPNVLMVGTDLSSSIPSLPLSSPFLYSISSSIPSLSSFPCLPLSYPFLYPISSSIPSLPLSQFFSLFSSFLTYIFFQTLPQNSSILYSSLCFSFPPLSIALFLVLLIFHSFPLIFLLFAVDVDAEFCSR